MIRDTPTRPDEPKKPEPGPPVPDAPEPEEPARRKEALPETPAEMPDPAERRPEEDLPGNESTVELPP